MTAKLRAWLWLSVVLAVAGGLMLYPIGTAALNVLFIVIKAGMVTGLAILIFSGKRAGFYIWASFCAGAVIMTLLKWNISGMFSSLIPVSIAVDIIMPAVAYLFIRNTAGGRRDRPEGE